MDVMLHLNRQASAEDTLMIEFKPLASSSAGCCYWLSDGNTPLLIECGIRWKEIQRALNFRTRDIAACLVSHEHQDHCRAIREVIRAGIPIYGATPYVVLPARMPCFRGTWRIRPFRVKHDVQCYGFLMASSLGGKAVYLTDAPYSPHRFEGLTHIFIEANYSEKILRENCDAGVIDSERYKRTLRNHMSIETVLELLKANDLSRVEEIWLLHLSGENSDAEAFAAAVEGATGKPTTIAPRGVKI